MATLYDESKLKKRHFFKSFFFLSAVLLAMLMVARFLNISLWWQVTKMELDSGSQGLSLNYYHMGLSTEERSKQKLILYAQAKPRQIAVVSFYTLLQPAVFLISNNNGGTFVNLGLLAVLIEPGLTKITLSCEDIIEKERNGHTEQKYFGNSLLAFLFKPESRNNPPSISYVVNALESTKFLKIPAIIYFYLPLILIIWLASAYGPGFYGALCYYLGIFLLFDFKRFMITLPFFWLFNLLKIDPPPWVSVLMAAVILMVFLVFITIGFRNLKTMKGNPWSRLLILFFILLPVFLRF